MTTPPLTSGITVLGNMAIDRIDAAPATPGGAPAFIGHALASLPGPCRVITRCADAHAPLFLGLFSNYPVPLTVLPSEHTNVFSLHYDGGDRQVRVGQTGHSWSPRDIDDAAITTEWVHCAPLLRGEFPAGTLHYMTSLGHQISFDAQGLVRPSQPGVLHQDAQYDRSILHALRVVKASYEEAQVLFGGSITRKKVALLEVPEVVVTLGEKGCTVFTSEKKDQVPPYRVVTGVHPTGAGEVFGVCYAHARAAGTRPRQAALLAAHAVTIMLERRASSTQGTPST
jgi:sugar/nucleoside kinase (ribokinase family)